MTSYDQGFIEKCAEFGIDPHELVKEAQSAYGVDLNTPVHRAMRASRSGDKAKSREILSKAGPIKPYGVDLNTPRHRAMRADRAADKAKPKVKPGGNRALPAPKPTTSTAKQILPAIGSIFTGK